MLFDLCVCFVFINYRNFFKKISSGGSEFRVSKATREAAGGKGGFMSLWIESNRIDSKQIRGPKQVFRKQGEHSRVVVVFVFSV